METARDVRDGYDRENQSGGEDIATTTCAQPCRKQPYTYSLTKKLEKSQAINCSIVGKNSGKSSVYSYPVLISSPSYLFCSPIRGILLFMFLGCNTAVCILTKPSPFCCPCNRGRDIHTFLPAFSSGCLDLCECIVRAAFSWSVACALVLIINKKYIRIHDCSLFSK